MGREESKSPHHKRHILFAKYHRHKVDHLCSYQLYGSVGNSSPSSLLEIYSCLSLRRAFPVIDFKFNLHLSRTQINFWPPFTRPAKPPGLSNAFPTSSPQAGSIFTIKYVGDELVVAHRPCSPPSCGVQHTASVSCTVGAEAVDLQSPSIIQIPADWPAHNSNTHDPLPVREADAKFMPCYRAVVAVVLLNKSVGFLERYGAHFKHWFLPPAGGGQAVREGASTTPHWPPPSPATRQ